MAQHHAVEEVRAVRAYDLQRMIDRGPDMILDAGVLGPAEVRMHHDNLVAGEGTTGEGVHRL